MAAGTASESGSLGAPQAVRSNNRSKIMVALRKVAVRFMQNSFVEHKKMDMPIIIAESGKKGKMFAKNTLTIAKLESILIKRARIVRPLILLTIFFVDYQYFYLNISLSLMDFELGKIIRF